MTKTTPPAAAATSPAAFRLHVGRLSRTTTDAMLAAHFPGCISSGIARSAGGKSKQHGFVEYADQAAADAAVRDLHDSQLDGVPNIIVKPATEAAAAAKTATATTAASTKPQPSKKQPAEFGIRRPRQALVDIGANLASRALKPHIAEVLKRSAAANTTTVLITGTSLKTSREALQIVKEHAGPVALFSTAGVHPHDATHLLSDPKTAATWVADLETLITANKSAVVAVGETGLDYDRKFSTHADQIRVFEAQLGIAERTGLPLFLHNRDAHDDFLAALQRFPRARRGVVHCYTDTDPAHLDAYLTLGFHIGITGWVADERRGVELAENIVPRIPLDRLLIETDAPYLMPRNIEGRKMKVNEPALLGWVCKKVAECLGVDEEVVAARTTENARQLFALPDIGA
ncbi:hypothetical protein HDU87_007734 [Geranomyces variabilis]|uniref:RRM domain-containing protein n=1 Tax=Geranomyces variabilis TaxID=109894 RepID=A0AAD5TDQ5_9FUNG|nr:hypothetical protein HDU87_007734 [Geranomyces variabilis]